MIIDKQKFLFLYEQREFKTLTESAQAGLVTHHHPNKDKI